MIVLKSHLERNADISLYAKPEYNWRQMGIIERGIRTDVDVSVFAKPEYSWEKMEEIRRKLLEESTL